MLNDKYKEHPYQELSDILIAAFEALEEKQKKHYFSLIAYKGVTKEAFEQLAWEDEKIKNGRSRIFLIYEEFLKTNNV